YWLPGGVDRSQGRITILDRFGDEPDCDEVIHLVYRDVLALQLLVNRIEPFDAPIDVDDLDVGRPHQLHYSLLYLVEDRFQAGAAAFHQLFELLIFFGLQIFEGKIFQFSAHAAHAPPVGDRSIDLQGLLGDTPALIHGEIFQRTHVMKPVSQLDQNHSDVVDHREQHLAHIEGLPLFGRSVVELGYLGQAFDQVGDFGAKDLLYRLDRGG